MAAHTPLHYDLDDLSPSARIRQAALELFAEKGARGTSLRQVAQRAAVSLGALSHYYPSKAALEDSVRDFVSTQVARAVVDDAMAATPLEEADRRRDAFHMFLRDHPVIAGYIRHELLQGGAAGARALQRHLRSTRVHMDRLSAAGYLRPLPDPEMGRVVYQMMSLIPFLFGDSISEATGIDLSTPEGMQRWRNAELDILSRGIIPNDREATAGRRKKNPSKRRG